VTRIAILDYGMGNLRSVEKALARAGAEGQLTRDPDAARAAEGVILPGVGAFPEAMRRLRELGLHTLVRELHVSGVPLLGICLGMQLLFESTSEHEGGPGLGVLPGPVERLQAGDLKVPHIGWSPVRWRRPSPLSEGLAGEPPFYFVHSFAPRPTDEECVLGTATYGSELVCAVEREPLYGVQFHPEKSSGAGLRLLANFAGICAVTKV
jgi:glutamine amidotransferase